MIPPENKPSFGLSRFPDLNYRRLYGMPTRTSDKSKTSPGEAVRELPYSDMLHNIARSDKLWDNLKYYGRAVWKGVADRTCTLPEGLKPPTVYPFPSVEKQRRAARTFHRWCELYTAVAEEDLGVTCELSIQDEVGFILIYGLGCAIRMRYAATHTITNSEDVSATDQKKTSDNKWVNQKNKPIPEPNVYTPGFVRAVAGMLRSTSGKELSKAGYPDWLLIWQTLSGGGTSGNRLAAEIKPFWAITDEAMANLVSGESADPGTGQVHCLDEDEGDSALGDLLLQIWGECHFLDVDYGFITNGSTIRIFIKTGPNELCFSDLKNWNDPDVFLALLGLCFVSIDHPTGKNDKIKGFLCAPDDRKCDWPKRAQLPKSGQKKPSPEPRSPTPSEYEPTDVESNAEQSDETQSEVTESDSSLSEVTDHESEGYSTEGDETETEGDETETGDDDTDTGRAHMKGKKGASAAGSYNDKERAARVASEARVTTRARAKVVLGTNATLEVPTTTAPTTTRNTTSRDFNTTATTTRRAVTLETTKINPKDNPPLVTDKAPPQTARRTKEVDIEQPEVFSDDDALLAPIPRHEAKAAKAGPSRRLDNNIPQVVNKDPPQTVRKTRSSKEAAVAQPEVSSNEDAPLAPIPRHVAQAAAKAGSSRRRD